MDNLKPLGKLDLATSEPITIAQRWWHWKLLIELSMPRKSEREKCNTFLYTIGQAGRDMHNTMQLTEGETEKIDILFAKFEAYCKPKQNVTIE